MTLCNIPRLGGGPTDAEEVKGHVFFESINWPDLYDRKVAPPFVPVVKSEVSVEYFDKEFTDEAPELTPPDESMSSSHLSVPDQPLTCLSLFSLWQVTPRHM